MKITETPIKKIKTFLRNDFYLKKNNKRFNEQINNILKVIINAKLNCKEDNLVLAKIIANLEIFLKDNNLITDNEFIPSDLELFEIDKMDEKNYADYLIYRYKYLIYPKKKIVSDYPPCLQIEPTSKCNFRCIMCYQSDKSFSEKKQGFMGDMNFELYKKIIDEVSGKIQAITLASRGEPTLNKELNQFLDYSKNKFLAFKLNTNASLLNDELVHKMLQCNIQTIVFSIDSAEKAQYEKIRVKSNFEKILNNLKNFTKIKENDYPDSKTIIRISGVKINSSQDLNKMNNLFSRYADFVGLTSFTPWQSSYENKINDIKEPCTELWRRMFVWEDGKVNPCDYDYKSMLSKENIINNTVKNIWTSNYYNQLRQKHLDKKRNVLEPCNRCIIT
jgi:MoaA/NifB/PqqE/SkfB family radical SAM enzyme